MIFALLHVGGHVLHPAAPVSPLWEETPMEQLNPGYHPMIRFGSWEITRFNRSTTYMFLTPDMVQQGQFQANGNRYFFRAVMANELENADKDKLIADMDGGTARGFNEAYARSMSNFEGNYDRSTNTLTISYPVKGMLRTFQLHPTNQGDDRLPMAASGAERGLVGLWQAPEPFPDKLDARTRTKVQEEGLQMFFQEASASDGAQFAVIDLRPDHSFRDHSTIGSWQRNGSTLTMFAKGKRLDLQISGDGSKLLSRGKAVYVR
ncbi:hypothetical protein [Fimbriimonas ginsengisoli]|nr:hypothetical protein [Fimbriimonas ginsengisoli]